MSATFNIYRREVGDTNPPVEIATGLTSKAYSDATAVSGKSYLYSVGAVVNSVERISDEIKCYAFDAALFSINSDFDINLADKAGKIWTAHGNANVSNGRLNFDGTGDYLTTSSSDKLNFNNSEDVTIRFKIKINMIKSSGVACLFSVFHYNGSVDQGYDVRITNTQIGIVMWTATNAMFTYTVPLNTEVEISIERHNMNWRLYVNGAQISTAITQSINYTKPQVLNPAYLGSGFGEGYGNQRDVDGSIRNFQIIKGLAVGGGQTTTPRI